MKQIDAAAEKEKKLLTDSINKEKQLLQQIVHASDKEKLLSSQLSVLAKKVKQLLAQVDFAAEKEKLLLSKIDDMAAKEKQIADAADKTKTCEMENDGKQNEIQKLLDVAGDESKLLKF